MSRFIQLAAAVTALVGILAAPSVAEAKLNVVATLPDLAAVAREVGGGDVNVTALAVSTQDPHFVDARPSLVLPLNRADLLILTGLQLEIGWLPNLITGARNSRINPGAQGYFDASTVVPLKQVPQSPIDRSMGDIHPGGNPHYMADPRNGARVGRAIATRLAALDPAHKAAYMARAKSLETRAEAYAAQARTRFAKLAAERRQVVVYHQSLVYLLDWLSLRQVNTLEPKPGIPPSPEHAASVLGQMRRLHVPAIAQEDYRPRNPGNLLASKAQARQVILPGGPDFENGQGYMAYIQELADKLYAGVAP